MLKLFTAPGACSMASDIALEETGIPFERKLVKFDEGYLDSPAYLKINPMGTVPCLEIEPGTTLTECVAILQYVAAQKPEMKLFPTDTKSLGYFKAMEWMNFIATELHAKSFGALFSASSMISDETARTEFVTHAKTMLLERCEIVNQRLSGKTYCLGDQFTVVDGYLFTILGWAEIFKVDLSAYPNIVGFQNRVFERGAVQRTFKAHGLI